MIAVSYDEIEDLGNLNFQSNMYLAVWVGLLGIIFGAMISALLSESWSPKAELIVYFACPILLILAIVFFVMMTVSYKTRKRRVSRLKTHNTLT